MYHYEQIMNEHRQRVARGAQNYERLRVAAERLMKKSVSEPNPCVSAVVDEGKSNSSELLETESEVGIEVASSAR
ncbi:putative uncharacterized protein [Rhodococcus sp. AW25M09]|uniref:hypothetical protein n=1 Tax=Rhodococcus sp. AW25M09 TaxID=1268303 RepID=UPI0002ABC663|nr:hypothetical protein [Rhodococcus sp. AW25M09]CCQ15757.1 putative uncharacterized protein [Rhodococcus sp. AW25M09]